MEPHPTHPTHRARRPFRTFTGVIVSLLAVTSLAGLQSFATAAPNGNWPQASGEQKLESRIYVSESFDGGMKHFTGWGGSQDEGQDPLFDLKPGATLRNVIIGPPAGDGVHCAGSCTLENVWWEDVGEDAATLMKQAPGNAVMTVQGGGARSASDKVFQHNGGGTVIIRDFVADDISVLYRSCGTGKGCGSQPKRTVRIENVKVTGNFQAIVRINQGDSATISNLDASGEGDICQAGKEKSDACQVS